MTCGPTSRTPASWSATDSPKPRNILRYASPFSPKLVPLCGVVDDQRLVLEHLRTEAVLGVEVGQRQDQRPVTGEGSGVLQHAAAVDGPHARVDDERGPAPRTIPTLGTSGTRPSGIT